MEQPLKVEAVESIAEKTKFAVGGRRATYVLIICCLLYAINWMDRQVFSVVAAPMMEALKLTKTQVGWIQNFFLLSMGLLAIPVSYLVDRWSRNEDNQFNGSRMERGDVCDWIGHQLFEHSYPSHCRRRRRGRVRSGWNSFDQCLVQARRKRA